MERRVTSGAGGAAARAGRRCDRNTSRSPFQPLDTFRDLAHDCGSELFTITVADQQQARHVQLLPKLDVEADDQVSQSKFEAGPHNPRKFDPDNDQTLGTTELLPSRDPLNRGAAVVTETAALPFVRITNRLVSSLGIRLVS